MGEMMEKETRKRQPGDAWPKDANVIVLFINWDAKGNYIENHEIRTYPTSQWARHNLIRCLGGDATKTFEYQEANLFVDGNVSWFKEQYDSNPAFLPLESGDAKFGREDGHAFWNGDYERFERNGGQHFNGEFDDGDDSIHWHLHPSEYRLGMEFLKICPGREIK